MYVATYLSNEMTLYIIVIITLKTESVGWIKFEFVSLFQNNRLSSSNPYPETSECLVFMLD